MLFRSSHSFHQDLFPDGAGAFSIALSSGQYQVTIQTEGYETLREFVDVTPGGGPLPIQFALKPLAGRSGLSGSKEATTSVPSLRVPQDARQEFEAGLKEMERRRLPQARKRFDKALEKYADFAQALQALAMLDSAEGQPQRAKERLRRAVQIEPTRSEERRVGKECRL